MKIKVKTVKEFYDELTKELEQSNKVGNAMIYINIGMIHRTSRPFNITENCYEQYPNTKIVGMKASVSRNVSTNTSVFSASGLHILLLTKFMPLTTIARIALLPIETLPLLSFVGDVQQRMRPSPTDEESVEQGAFYETGRQFWNRKTALPLK